MAAPQLSLIYMLPSDGCLQSGHGQVLSAPVELLHWPEAYPLFARSRRLLTHCSSQRLQARLVRRAFACRTARIRAYTGKEPLRLTGHFSDLCSSSARTAQHRLPGRALLGGVQVKQPLHERQDERLALLASCAALHPPCIIRALSSMLRAGVCDSVQVRRAARKGKRSVFLLSASWCIAADVERLWRHSQLTCSRAGCLRTYSACSSRQWGSAPPPSYAMATVLITHSQLS